MSVKSSHKRIQDIQCLRGIAVIMVLLHHIPAVQLQTPSFLWVGWTGVDIFFVISGYLVARSMQRNLTEYGCAEKRSALGTVAILKFLYSRITKILPAAYAAIALWLIARQLVPAPVKLGVFSPKEIFTQIVANSLLVINYSLVFMVPAYIHHFWSLSVELHYYLFYPFVRFFQQKRTVRVLTLLGIWFVSAAILRPLTPVSGLSHRFYTHLHIDGMILGSLLFEFEQVHPWVMKHFSYVVGRSWLTRMCARLFGGFLIAIIWLTPWMFGFNSPFTLIFGIPLITILSGIVVALSLLDQNIFGFGFGWLLRYVGNRSYTIYLIHPIVYSFMLDSFVLLPAGPKAMFAGGEASLNFALAYMGFLLLITEIFFRAIEVPATKLPRRTPNLFKGIEFVLSRPPKEREQATVELNEPDKQAPISTPLTSVC